MATIEWCEACSNGWDMPRTGNGPVGIWGWDCDRLTIQHCISHDNMSPGDDGGGFDLDGGATNCVMQYNLSYRNQGTGYLLCQFPNGPEWSNNTVRYNISLNDGEKSFHSGIGLFLSTGRISGAQVYNNTIVNPVHAVSTVGDIPGVVYRNNIFVGGSDLLSGDFSSSRFEKNVYWHIGTGAIYRSDERSFYSLDEWSAATGQELIEGVLAGKYADPGIVLPGSDDKLPTDPRYLSDMPFFRLLANSPCLGSGACIA